MHKREENEEINSLLSALLVICQQCKDKATFTVERSQTDSNLSILWHTRLGHPGADALSHLSAYTEGVPRFVFDKTICETCQLVKATKIVLRSAERETPERHPF